MQTRCKQENPMKIKQNLFKKEKKFKKKEKYDAFPFKNIGNSLLLMMEWMSFAEKLNDHERSGF